MLEILLSHVTMSEISYPKKVWMESVFGSNLSIHSQTNKQQNEHTRYYLFTFPATHRLGVSRV